MKVNKSRSSVKQKAATIEAVRDNLVAHRSLDLIQGTVAKLPPIPWDDVDAVVSDIQVIYNSVVEHYEGHPESFEPHQDYGRRSGNMLLSVFEGHDHCQTDHKQILFGEFRARFLRPEFGEA